MIVVIDNYDSFTYNLVQYLGELGAGEIRVFRNDQITVAQVAAMKPDKLLVSPGPCTPTEAGISCELIGTLGPKIPLLGVCLGHQSIGQVFGGKVIRAPNLMHGKTSMISHDGLGVFKDMPNPFEATRYHSLIVERESLPACLIETAKADTGEIMGLRHRDFPVHGVQFHPESVLTQDGRRMIRNFLAM
jgi:anthranilate synthase/aminodeoxychorismate synthase-like glutamine amidotransferase